MSRLFGEIRQNGYVVRDLEASMHHWTTVLGVGPFFHLPHVAVSSFEYGTSTDIPDISIGLANSGDLQIELIQQHDDTPTMYRDFLAAHGEGLQHVSAWVSDLGPALEELTAVGQRIGQRGTMQDGAIEFVYFDTELHPGTVFEISNLLGDLAFVPEMIAAAARDWDGTDPVRAFDP